MTTVGPAPAASPAAEAGRQAAALILTITQWSRHHSQTRQLAARIALELVRRPDHSRVESSMRLARQHGTSNTMAANARRLLMGAGLVYQSGRHYYKAPFPGNGTGR